ncbi:Tyrosine kinase receptor Cad96Ca [Danaus plexippus plexippus]|uniref:Tyrosine kinase receptor Cad96Ca n=1 Tax=Danaus plexippus plexippus TaxID=278856 RepID=A0A212FFQ1_DANPL|nr:Tyrosine kinase receptor Cad96Ca [Danaus plexippus plexippus]
MVEKAEVKPESLLNLDDLLQCPVCYEIPSGQIFQCNEGHHVCGRCKMRLDVCPKLGAKPTNGSGSSESSTPAKDTTTGECENDVNEEDEENNLNLPNVSLKR